MGIRSTVSFIWNHPLNRPHRWKALGRFARWQIVSRFGSDYVGLPFVENTRLFVRHGMTGATGNYYCGLHEFRDMAFVLHLLRRGELFLDVGANVGSYTILAAGAVGAKVLAVEPICSTIDHLRTNVMRNHLEQLVETCEVGLSDCVGELAFTAKLGAVNHVAVAGEEYVTVAVAVTTADTLCRQRIPAVIKIDVEGHELAVLKGADRILQDSILLAVVIETNGSGARYGVANGELIQVMRSHGFEPFAYDPFSRCLIDPYNADGNTIFVRDFNLVARRLRDARRYRLINGEI